MAESRRVIIGKKKLLQLKAFDGSADLSLDVISLTEALKVTYADIKVPGASHPIYQWIYSNGRIFYITAVVIDQGGSSVNELLQLRNLVFPKYAERTSLFQAGAPPVIEVTIGDFIKFNGIVEDLSFDYQAFHPSGIAKIGGKPRIVEVNLTINEIVNVNNRLQFVSRSAIPKAKVGRTLAVEATRAIARMGVMA